MPQRLTDKVIDLSKIRDSNKHFKRSDITTASIEDLADNIDKLGQLQQLIVRPIGKGGSFFELLAGSRRLQALKRLGHKKARCVIMPTDDDRAILASICENLKHQPLSKEDRRRAEETLSEYYTKLFAAEEPEPEEPPQKRKGSDVLKRRAGKQKTVQEKVKEKIAGDLGISTKTVERDAKYSENLIPASIKAHEMGRLTDKQLHKLSNMKPVEQRKNLPEMIRDTAEERQRREQKEEEAKKSSPTTVSRQMLEGILFGCKDQNARVEDFLKFVDGKDIDYKALRKAGLELAERSVQLLGELLEWVTED